MADDASGSSDYSTIVWHTNAEAIKSDSPTGVKFVCRVTNMKAAVDRPSAQFSCGNTLAHAGPFRDCAHCSVPLTHCGASSFMTSQPRSRHLPREWA